MNRVVYEISDGTKTHFYEEALKKEEEGLTFKTTFVWEDLPVDKIDEGVPVSDKKRSNSLRPLPKPRSRI